MDPVPTRKIQQEKKLTPEEISIARSIENFKWLEDRDKVFLLLVWRGLKRATAVSLFADSSEAKESMSSVLEQAKLLHKFGPSIMNHMRGLNPGHICYVAKTEKDLDLLANKWMGNHDKDREVFESIGKLSGFPQTAIDTYSKFSHLEGYDKSAKIDELTIHPDEKHQLIKEKYGLKYYPFSLFFYMSKDSFEEEMKTVIKWVDEIELVAPNLLHKFNDFFEKKL